MFILGREAEALRQEQRLLLVQRKLGTSGFFGQTPFIILEVEFGSFKKANLLEVWNQKWLNK